ncbi:MAG: hypothetical protein JNM18_26985 [Planctomycetaceae bacterium]|nr:hypothetical protein [Planctomycetaceae bacterium]
MKLQWRLQSSHDGMIELMGVGMLPGSYQQPQGFFVTLTIVEIARAREIIQALSEGGAIKVPFEKTF